MSMLSLLCWTQSWRKIEKGSGFKYLFQISNLWSTTSKNMLRVLRKLQFYYKCINGIYIPIYLSIYGCTVLLLDLGRFFSFLILYTVGRTSWTGNQPVARPLPNHRTTQTQNKCTQTSILWVGFEPTIPAFERGKTVHTLDRSATVIGNSIYLLIYVLKWMSQRVWRPLNHIIRKEEFVRNKYIGLYLAWCYWTCVRNVIVRYSN
jgi:hypothetical protein